MWGYVVVGVLAFAAGIAAVFFGFLLFSAWGAGR